MASLQWGDAHRCGATLIAPDLLITAGHCAFVRWEEEEGVKREWFTIEELSAGFVPSIYTVQLGKISLNFDDDYYFKEAASSSFTETLVIDEIIVHPHYNITKESGPPHPDVALVKVYSSAKYFTKFAKLNTNLSHPPHYTHKTNPFNNITTSAKINLTTMGYGATYLVNSDINSPPTKELENILHQTKIEYVPNEDCMIMGGGGFWNLLEEDMLCGYGDGERDSCSGDR